MLKKILAVWVCVLLGACGGGQDAATPDHSTPPPIAPTTTAQNLQAVTAQSTPVTAGLVAVPARADHRFVMVTAPAHGSVTLQQATFTYTPAQDYVGTDSFSYAVDNGDTPSAPATVSLDVLSSAAPSAPNLATACSDLGSSFSPLCSAIATVSAPLVQGCSAAAPTDFCKTFGGDLYSLAAGCFTSLSGQSATLCKAVATALQGIASQCRVLGAPDDFCALFSGSAIGDREVRAYQTSPVHRALQQQWQLGLSLPLRDALVPATHNSFNYTNASTPPALSGLDPDQLYSFTQQLNMDIRGMELDVHWFPSVKTGANAPLLCHAQPNHIGCTIERTLADGLQEIRAWLDAHPDQVIILDVEEHLDDQIDDVSQSFPAAAAVIESTLGKTSAKDLILRPGEPGADGSCSNHKIPLDLSPAQILAAGKQVLIYSSGCGHDAGWDAIIHDQSNRLQGPSTDFGDSQYSDCHFSRAQYESSWTRFYDSSTLVDAVSGSGTALPVSPAQIRQMVRCGVDMPSINFLDPHTEQLRSYVWSWAYGQPLASASQACAVHNGDGYFQAEACGQLLAYACDDGNNWQVTRERGAFADGEAACATEYPGSHFAVPRNGYQNELLKTAKTQASTDRVWLNDTDQASVGVWVAAP